LLRLLASPRRRRRLAWLLVVGAAVGGAVAIGVVFANTGESQELPFSDRAADVYVPPEEVPLTQARAVAAKTVAARFVSDAVLRRAPERSWELSTENLRAGSTVGAWRRGELPVVPYPSEAFDFAKWRLSYSYADRAGFDVLMQPKLGSDVRPSTFTIELKAFRDEAGEHWLVDYWAPKGTADPVPADPEGAQRRAVAPPVKTGIGAIWLLVPVGIVGAAVAFAVGLGVLSWRRNVRAEREYRQHSQARL
jgi:hypothetical protein